MELVKSNTFYLPGQVLYGIACCVALFGCRSFIEQSEDKSEGSLVRSLILLSFYRSED